MLEAEKKNREELFHLMRENPGLPVVPMVNSEIVCDDYCSYWMGSWGRVELNAYVIGDERVYFRDDDSDDMEDVLNHTVGGQDWYKDATEEEVEKAYAALQWVKAIVVYIECPQEVGGNA